MKALQKELFFGFILLAALSILVEIYLSKKRGYDNYSFKESKISFIIFILGNLVNLAMQGLTFSILEWVYSHRLFEISMNRPVKFALLFFCSEFLYYWMHRYSHEVRWGWASHLVHHSPENFNFSVAYRLGLTGFFSLFWIFHLPLALIGFPPQMIVLSIGLGLFYQFWIHTELIGKLGWFEKIFNTPSHHRVHHASNAEYLDKNYGGVFIFFDKIFGTFKEESELVEIKYGLTEKVSDKRSLPIAFLGWTQLWRDLKKQTSLKMCFLLLTKNPGWANSKTRQV